LSNLINFKRFIKKFLGFAFLSATGLCLDVLTYIFLLSNHISIFLSSLIGSFLAITYVFIFSGFWIFRKKNFVFSRYILWIAYQFFNVIFFSLLVNYLYGLGLAPLIAKLVSIPLSFIINFIVASKIMK